MRLAAIRLGGAETASVETDSGLVPISEINKISGKNWSENIPEIIRSGQLEEIKKWYSSGGKEKTESSAQNRILKEEARSAPLIRNPGKIWGIGLNYAEHAGDLSEKPPAEGPGTFIKFASTVIGPGDEIRIPLLSEKTTGEAELAVIYGRKCREIEPENWLSAVAGFTTVIDMTAEDILRRNPRYLTQSRNFDTFFSLGSVLVTPDEIGDIMKIRVSTVINGEVYASDIVENMTYPPDFLVSYLSKIATMEPCDIISTGTPRAVHIKDGDLIECRIDGFDSMSNPVADLKLRR